MTIRRPEKPAAKRKRKRADDAVRRDPTLLDDLLAIAAGIPEEDLARLPKDGSRNLEHYLYGTPKKDP